MGATISRRAHLCVGTHDHTKPLFSLLRPPISNRAGSVDMLRRLVGPGITIGKAAIVGASAVVTKDLALWTIAVGNSARAIKRREITQ
jgi:putative colanic acid biosynthesis acetyltransferase WcaF